MEAKQYVTKQPRDHWRNQRGNQKIPRDNDNENKMIQNLWDAAKVVLRGKFIAIQAYLKKKEKSQIKKSNLTPKGTRERRTNKTQS